MKSRLLRTAAPFITTIQKLFSEDLAKENDFVRQENKILRSKLGKRVPLTEAAAPETVQCESALGGLLNHYHAERRAA